MNHQAYDEESFTAGASASLKRSLKDIEAIVEGWTTPPGGPKRERFREALRRHLREAALRWYRIGFRRGHKTCLTEFERARVVPPRISKTMARVTFVEGEGPEEVILKSDLTRKKAARRKKASRSSA